jgi:[acyl-carrier-protein] S-malonyltransferase
MAGHSVGEYSALVAAGALSFDEGIRLVQERARLMAAASAAQPGTLAAILGSDEATVEGVCRDADVDLCNRNLPSQSVIGGSKEAVARAIELAKERGAYRAMELNVSGAFHSRLMAPAAAGLKPTVASTAIALPLVPVVANVTALPFEDAASIRRELGEQVVSPVRWHESVAFMTAAGVSEFIEFGPGRVLTGLVKRLIPGSRLANVSNFTEAASIRDAAVQSTA